MAVFTQVSDTEARELLRRLQLGTLHALRGIEGGIENTNYFVTCDEGEYVLTLFERLTAEQLPFYLYLMKHLAHKGIPVPDPRADKAGDILHTVCGKPAAVVNRLAGRSQLAPEAVHCAAVGDMLARMHLAARDYDRHQPNLRSLPWWNETVPVVLPHIGPDAAALVCAELAYQNHIAASPAYAALPRGPVHADLFRDNVMFEGEQLTGFFDFYFAGVDTFLFDLAVCLNDWCIDLPTGRHDAERAAAMLGAYQAVRPLTAAERALLPAMARAGALRFWISRLWDFYLPREASMLTPHDPTHFERVLRQRIEHPVTLGPDA
ncbi:MAG TPA: homoserine kinase [Comamonadaceae bacterium]|nr:homoserine kinase [Comamonadaceae bacterium]